MTITIDLCDIFDNGPDDVFRQSVTTSAVVSMYREIVFDAAWLRGIERCGC